MIINKLLIIINILFLFILSSCITVYNYNLEPVHGSKYETKVYLHLYTIQPNVEVYFFINSNSSIQDLNINNNGFIQIDENQINFTSSSIKHSLQENETNSIYEYYYQVYFQGLFDERIDEIKENKIFKIYLEYTVMINNELIKNSIDEEYNLKIKKNSFTMFRLYKAAIFDGWRN
jgi:hypothetical protein